MKFFALLLLLFATRVHADYSKNEPHPHLKAALLELSENFKQEGFEPPMLNFTPDYSGSLELCDYQNGAETFKTFDYYLLDDTMSLTSIKAFSNFFKPENHYYFCTRDFSNGSLHSGTEYYFLSVTQSLSFSITLEYID